jgi:hypothetical protein
MLIIFLTTLFQATYYTRTLNLAAPYSVLFWVDNTPPTISYAATQYIPTLYVSTLYLATHTATPIVT